MRGSHTIGARIPGEFERCLYYDANDCCDNPEHWTEAGVLRTPRFRDVLDAEIAADHPGPQPPVVPPLEEWWQTIAKREIDAVVPKAIEYGSYDLHLIGKVLGSMLGRKVDNAEAEELGVTFYALGKIARIVSAVRDGRRPSDDSWHDLGVYARMAQRIREAGGWPG